jgi:soluble P-type ATPase
MKGTKLKFHIVVGQGANDRGKLRAECLGTTELQTAISRCIASRPRPNDLQSLLVIIIEFH